MMNVRFSIRKNLCACIILLCCQIFGAKAQDAGIVAISAPVEPFPEGQQAIEVVLENFGTALLSSTIIQWEINDIPQPQVNWAGTLNPSETQVVNLGNYAFSAGVAYKIKAWSEYPNTVPDVDPYNDTSQVADLYAALNGSYTLGGVSPTFMDFGHAVTTLEKGGITGAVAINVRSGTYAEQISIPEIRGASPLHTITFQSETGDSTAVTLTHSSSSRSDNYTLQINGADHISFRHLTLAATGTTYGRVLEISNGGHFNQFSNNVFQGVITTSIHDDLSVIGSGASTDNHNVFYRNRILDGSTGILLEASGRENGNSIEQNLFEQQQYQAIYVINQEGVTIKGNQVQPQGIYGIRLYNASPAGMTNGEISNNFITVGGTGLAYGIYLHSSDGQHVYANNVHITSTHATAGIAANIVSSTNIALQNNILVNSGPGYAIYVDGSSGLTASDHNDLFTLGSQMGYWGADQADLAAWQGASGLDANSISVDPLYMSDTDLHIQSAALFDKGIPIAGLDVDIDGDIRDPSTPDIGADEYRSAVGDDAGIAALLNPVIPFAEGSQSIDIALVNFGYNDLTSVTVNWELDGQLQTPFPWSGTIPPTGMETVSIGMVDFMVGQERSLKIWTSAPNTTPDVVYHNDTIWADQLYPALNGSYNISGIALDFTDISSAVNALNFGGVTGPVTFHIADGSYHEQLHVKAYPGASVSNPVLFKGASEDHTAVILYDTANVDDRYTLLLDGASHISFEYMTIEARNDQYARVIEIQNGASHNRFEHNRLKGIPGSGTSPNKAIVYSNTADNHNNRFIQNTFVEGNYGIYLLPSTGEQSGILIASNQFDHQSYQAIRIEDHVAPNLQKNSITSTTEGEYYGIYLRNCSDEVILHENQVHIPYSTAPWGVYLRGLTGNPVSPSAMVNNFIYLGNSANTYALQCWSVSHMGIYYNNIEQTGISASNSRAANFFSCDPLAVQNNIFVNNAGGYAIRAASSNFTTLDYNNYYTTGPALGFWDTDQADLGAWQSASGFDLNSFSVDPMFGDDGDLHVLEVTLNNEGTPISGITTDIDDQTRHTTKPDIGADEFDVPLVDAGIVALTHPVPYFPEGNHPLMVDIRNMGLDPLTSATIQWSVNGTMQPSYSWTGSLLSGHSENVATGSYDFQPGVAYELNIWTEDPNGIRDVLLINDSTLVDTLYASLQGSYTIGGSAPDFTTIGEAVLALENGGVTGPVDLLLRSGIYHEQIIIHEIPEASLTHTITIQSESGNPSDVEWSFNPSAASENFVLQLDGADYITIRDITLKTLNTTLARVIDLKGNTHDNQFIGNILEGSPIPSADITEAIVYAHESEKRDNDFTGNTFNHGSYGIFYWGEGAASTGLHIQANTFADQHYQGVHLQAISAPEVAGNQIRSASPAGDYKAVHCWECADNTLIKANEINITHGGTGIHLEDCFAAVGNEGLVANNFVHVGGSGIDYGIHMDNAWYQNLYFNSINLTSTDAVNGRALYSESGQAVALANNIITNHGGGYAVYLAPASIVSSDYNNLFVTGANVGHWSGDATHLVAWQSLSLQDANSVNLDPLFFADHDLHILQSQLDGIGTDIPGFTLDIDGEIRNSPPDIGADETDFPLNDVGIYALIEPAQGCDLGSTHPVTVKILNFGTQAQTGFDIVYAVNGGTPVVENVGPLQVAPGGSETYTFLAAADVSALSLHSFEIYTQLTADENLRNDTLITSISNHPVLGPVTDMLPAHGTVGLPQPLLLSWVAGVNASHYDVYVWPAGTPRPLTPVGYNLTAISYAVDGLDYSTTYNWQVVSKNVHCDTDGPVQEFTLRPLPDLIVRDVQAPRNPLSGHTIAVDWAVENIGLGGTGSQQWPQYLYLSNDSILDVPGDISLGQAYNLASLNSGESYMQTTQVTLPATVSGDYYVIVHTDSRDWLLENADTNNINVSDTVTIGLSPFPDLVVTKTYGGGGFSGETYALGMDIVNTGSGPTIEPVWFDRIYLSKDSIFNPRNAQLLASLECAPYDTLPSEPILPLQPDSSYLNEGLTVLPDGIFGDYYYYWETDARGQVFEHALDHNNMIRTGPKEIFLSPPPDLAIVNMPELPFLSAGLRRAMSFQVVNQGADSTEHERWQDRLYLCPDTAFNERTAIFLGQYAYTAGPLQVVEPIVFPFATSYPESYYASMWVNIPHDISGPYYLYAITDYHDQLFEYTFEDNNKRRSVDPIIIRNPDLTVGQVTVPALDSSGQMIAIDWQVINNGPGDITQPTTWRDKIFLSSDMNFDPQTDTELGSFDLSIALSAGDVVNRSEQVMLPHGISGTYYIFVQTDASNKIYEDQMEHNNVAMSSAIQIRLSQSPDLIVDLITVQGTVTAGDTIQVSSVIRNIGVADIAISDWQDKIFISAFSPWDPVLATPLGQIDHSFGSVASGNSYITDADLTIPVGLSAGTYYIYVWADANDHIYEHLAEQNNILGQAVNVQAYPPIDLALTEINAPGTAFSGSRIIVDWIVDNVGQGATLAPSWYDGIYLSTDVVLDPSDTLLLEWEHDTTMVAMGQYQETRSVTIPNGFSGQYYLLAQTDNQLEVMDANRTNNTQVVRDAGGVPLPINIILSPSPDLTVDELNLPVQGIAGQPLEIDWKIRNRDADIISTTWIDNIYISSDFILDPDDILLGSVQQSGDLYLGDSYRDTLSVVVPRQVAGNQVIILKTDYTDVLYEHQAEANNLSTSPILIVQQPPADLIVADVSLLDDTVLMGDGIGVLWDILNVGTNNAHGGITEAIYLSHDTLLDPDDHIMSTCPHYIRNLGQNDTIHRYQSALTANINPGSYYVIVKTDIQDNINESDNGNNYTVSDSTLFLDVRELTLEVMVTPRYILQDQEEVFYKIIIPGGLHGETMRVSFESDSLDSANELYLRFGALASGTQHDFSHQAAFSPNQEIVVPALDSGTYYLMVKANHTHHQFGTRLLASIVPFEIASVDANQGGNTGGVTAKLEGYKFTANMEIRLENASLGPPIVAYNTYFIDAANLFASFNLIGAPIGVYDVIAEKPGGEADTLFAGFEILAGPTTGGGILSGGSASGGSGGGQTSSGQVCNLPAFESENGLQINIQHPSGSTPWTASFPNAMYIHYRNIGTVDIPVPEKVVISLTGAPIAFTPNGLDENKLELLVELSESGGPPGILRPNAGGTLLLYTRAGPSTLRFDFSLE